MQAGFREVDQLRRARLGLHLIGMHAVQEGARGIRPVGILIRQGRAIILGVPAFAADHTGMAADAGVKVNDQAQLLSRGGFGKVVIYFCPCFAKYMCW